MGSLLDDHVLKDWWIVGLDWIGLVGPFAKVHPSRHVAGGLPLRSAMEPMACLLGFYLSEERRFC